MQDFQPKLITLLRSGYSLQTLRRDAAAGLTVAIIAGCAGLGRRLHFIPMPVIIGFTAGIAVSIASSQVGDFLGLAVSNVPADFVGKWNAYTCALLSISGPTMPLAVGKLAPQVPAYLRVIMLGSAVVSALQLPIATNGDRVRSLLRMAGGKRLLLLLTFGLTVLVDLTVAIAVIHGQHESGRQLAQRRSGGG